MPSGLRNAHPEGHRLRELDQNGLSQPGFSIVGAAQQRPRIGPAAAERTAARLAAPDGPIRSKATRSRPRIHDPLEPVGDSRRPFGDAPLPAARSDAAPGPRLANLTPGRGSPAAGVAPGRGTAPSGPPGLVRLHNSKTVLMYGRLTTGAVD